MSGVLRPSTLVFHRFSPEFAPAGAPGWADPVLNLETERSAAAHETLLLDLGPREVDQPRYIPRIPVTGFE